MFSHPLAQASCRAQYPALSRWFTSQILFSKQYRTTSCGERGGHRQSAPQCTLEAWPHRTVPASQGTHLWV